MSEIFFAETGYFEFLQSAKDNEANNLQLRAVDLKLAKNGSEEISVEDNINGAEVVLKCNTDFEFDLFFNKNICQFNDKLGICFEKGIQYTYCKIISYGNFLICIIINNF